MVKPYIHETAEISPLASIGENVQVWNHSKIREGASIGDECVIGQNVYIDFEVSIGSRVKIQNSTSIYHGVTIEDGVFIGPHVCFTNDLTPRAITTDGRLKTADDWQVTPIVVHYGASIGAGTTLVPGVHIGRFAMIGAGSVVTRSVSDHALVYGNPARLHGYVCQCGRKLENLTEQDVYITGTCPACREAHSIVLHGREEIEA
jgi:UDP-2-acetamido-3-amino-2,3-dideoxy-glucuronate N-acetyltransferase